jgi:DNA-binding XRE family transcriptional regulator
MNFATYVEDDRSLFPISEQIEVRAFSQVNVDSIIAICDATGKAGFALVLDVVREPSTSKIVCLGELDISMYCFPSPKKFEICRPQNEKRAGETLRQLRKDSNFTQLEIAREIGVPQSHISQYELGQRNIPKNKARILAGMFGCSVKEFVNDN